MGSKIKTREKHSISASTSLATPSILSQMKGLNGRFNHRIDQTLTLAWKLVKSILSCLKGLIINFGNISTIISKLGVHPHVVSYIALIKQKLVQFAAPYYPMEKCNDITKTPCS